MGLIPFALSIHQLVSSVGADVGFAAMVGLAILVLLYFAQARETANLREQAYEASQRVEQLEARIAQVARRQTVSPAPPVAAPPAGVVAVSRVVPSAVAVGARAQSVPGPPAGVAAPALASATRVVPAMPVSPPAPAVAGSDGAGSAQESRPEEVPAAEPASAEIAAVAPAGATVPEGAAVVAAASAAEPAAAGTIATGPPASGDHLAAANVMPAEPASEVTAVAGTAHDSPAGPLPATFAGAGNGASRDTAYAPAVPDDGPPSVADRAPPPPPERPRPRQISPRRPPSEPQRPQRRSRAGRLVALLAGAAAAGAVVVVLLIVTGKSNTPSGTSQKHLGARAGRASGFNPSKVTVTVLNGTAVNGLASRTLSRLKALGYKQGTIATASNQTYTSTIVAFFPGHRVDALRVARALRLKPAAVQPIDSSTQGVACPQSPCTANVVVTAGADISSP